MAGSTDRAGHAYRFREYQVSALTFNDSFIHQLNVFRLIIKTGNFLVLITTLFILLICFLITKIKIVGGWGGIVPINMEYSFLLNKKGFFLKR